ncbi:hypothetical protein [Alicyclobacillus sp. SO9]|uniref:hypothetical protein n=1 Tax=Alicyclobacillus sp. SO9 TaxID=2665646 RepID=UPI0018E8FA14|nr:hypothetical protein [Alicyclobacillus sp. SO9]QQE79367.1 hypothetical protein GI364_02340 [Alicyclobacillus sp. SO9]
MLFDVGKVKWSREVLVHPGITQQDLIHAFERYIVGDWGAVTAEQSLSNDVSLTSGGSTVAKYESQSGVAFYFCTEAEGTKVMLEPILSVFRP